MDQLQSAPRSTEHLDELDFAILMQLQQDGRRSFTDMAEQLGVSVSTIRTRATKLIEDKTIQIVGRVNTQRVGFRAYVHIKISVRPAKLIELVAQELQELQEVSFLAITSGDFDIQVDLMCRDNDHLLKIVNERIPNINGVYQTKTDMYLKILKYAQPDLSLLL